MKYISYVYVMDMEKSNLKYTGYFDKYTNQYNILNYANHS